MNAIRQITPSRMARTSFQCWRVTNGLSQPHPVTGETLAYIERELATETHHGDTFLIAETLTLSDKTTLHAVLIRRGKAVGWGVNGKRTYAFRADRLLSVAVKAFEPVLPWRCVPGADRLGANNFIEGKRA